VKYFLKLVLPLERFVAHAGPPCAGEGGKYNIRADDFCFGLDLFCPDFWGVRKNFHRSCTNLRRSFGVAAPPSASRHLLLYSGLRKITEI
jgi:hypothetical protein